MATDLTKRMMIRFAPEDIAWIEEQAADEGVDNATLVRMLINRLRRGRPPLMRALLAKENRPSAEDREFIEGMAERVEINVEAGAEAVLQHRLEEIAGGDVEGAQAAQNEGNGAISLRHQPRANYNPGRQ